MSSIWDGEDTLAGVIWILTSVGAVNWGLLEFLEYNAVAGIGIATFQLFDVDFGATQFTLSGIGLSTAWLLGYGSIVGTILTNENTELQSLSDDIQGLQGWYMFAAVGTLILPVAFIVFPDTVGSFFQSSDLWGLLYVVGVTAGQFALGWML